VPKSAVRIRLPSMKDVAKRAGVSQTTVSFVLNNVESANIPLETQERVLAAIEALSYRPNAMARQLRLNRTHTIGFLSDNIATTPHAGNIIQGAQDRAWAQEYLLLVVNTSSHVTVEKAAIDLMLERRVDGIIYATMYHRAVTLLPSIREVPTVLLDCFCADRSLPSIVPDEVRGGRTAIELLLRKGHRRLGFINNVDLIPATFGRLQGYQQALAAHGIAYDQALVCAQHSDQAGGYRGVNSLMRLAEPPTAIFCFNDRMAMGAYDALHKLGCSIPADVAVIGYDNQELIAAYLYPPLTTLQLPHYQMGQWAVQHLLTLIENPEGQNGHPPVQELCECPLIERSSI